MKRMSGFGRVLRCTARMAAAFYVFVFATVWVFPTAADGSFAAPDWYALTAAGVAAAAFARHWIVLRRWERDGKPPFDWRLLWRAVGVYVAATLVYAIVLLGMYPEGETAPYWADGLVVGLPTILTTGYVLWCRGKKRIKTTREPMQEKTPEPVQTEPRQTITADPGAMYLHRLRCLDDRIPGEKVSEQIRQMVRTLEQIFAWSKEHPESDTGKLMDHYLPMSVKLLERYADMDALGVEGENIRSSMRQIEDTLEELNRAYGRLMDDLVERTAMDVASDISVLKAILAREGLVEDELSKMRRSSME